MRRKDREVTDFDQMLQIMERCDCCRLGFHDGESTYIVPLNFGIVQEDGRLVLYFHSANEGKKLDLLRAQPRVGFELDTAHQLVPGETPGSCTFRYQSIIGHGEAALVSSAEEKIRGLDSIMVHYGQQPGAYPPALLERVAVIRLVVTDWSCKQH